VDCNNVVVGLVGYKSGCEQHREVHIEEATALASSWEKHFGRVCFTETSSLTGKNVDCAAARAVQQWVKLMTRKKDEEDNDSPRALTKPSEAKRTCIVC